MHNKNIWVVVGIIVIVVAGFFIFQNKKIGDVSLNKIVDNSPVVNNPVKNTTPTDNQPEPSISFSVTPYLVEVAWQNQLTNVSENCEGKPGCDYSTKYIVGQITNGALKGQTIYLRAQGEMGGDYYDHYVISNGKKVSLEENKFTIHGISDLPEEIAFPGSNYKMKKWYSPSMLYKDVKPVKKLFSMVGLGDFYLTDHGCIMIELPDHTAIAYDFKIPFVNAENGEVNLTFNGNVQNNEQYEFTRIGGCGAVCMYLADVKDTELKLNDRLILAGKASNGEDFYEYKNSSDPTLQALYNDKNTVAYISNESGNYQQVATNKYTYQQFTNFHPLMYWKDPLGRWIEFKNKRFLIAAEKCKPVIYLYPTEKTNLNVQVTPNGGFIKTIPQYTDDGWNVEANPNGNVVDLKTGNNYDYLYWSGIGLNYPINETEGWIVKKENIASFLDEKLKILGLNTKEIADFKEYWVTKLSDMPYYQISFLPKNQLDQMAPLKISPVYPDTVIRVMLTAKGLTQAKDIKPQVLPVTPERNGFIVAEWGGVLLR